MSQDEEIVRHKAGELIHALERLTAEAKRLRGDVVRLYERIEPAEGEVLKPVPDVHGAIATVQQAFDAISGARRQISQAEYDLNFIRGRIAQLMSSGWSREAMKW